eukprot:5872433-Prorocentrum_lima.AAC.1
MTSSLVGSEMCIRDRDGCVWAWPSGLDQGPGGSLQWGVLGGGSPGLRPCLLYTSDAADDM